MNNDALPMQGNDGQRIGQIPWTCNSRSSAHVASGVCQRRLTRDQVTRRLPLRTSTSKVTSHSSPGCHSQEHLWQIQLLRITRPGREALRRYLRTRRLFTNRASKRFPTQNRAASKTIRMIRPARMKRSREVADRCGGRRPPNPLHPERNRGRTDLTWGPAPA